MSKNALDKIVEGGKMPVLFVGSGISKRYLYKYPDWEGLLINSFKVIDPDSFLYQKYFDELNRQGFSTFQTNIHLGSYVEDEFNKAFFDRKIKLNIGNRKNPNWVNKGISPYKMYLSNLFKKMKLYKNPRLDAELEKFRSLKNKIAAIITTNYDLFLEKEVFGSDYSVFVNQSDLFSADSYNIAEIYKIHGSANDANSLVVTKKDYDEFESSRKLIIAKMLTLFAESPLIFMGYSFTDENIQNIIADFISCLNKEQLRTIDSHFIFISYEKGQEELVESKTNIMTASKTYIPLTEIKTDNFSLVYDTLSKIVPGVSPLRIRQTRKIVKKIVDQSIASTAAESIIVGLDKLDNIDFSSKPLAIAVGYRESILNKYGYGLLSDTFIVEDILFDNKDFDAEEMCFVRFKSLPKTRLLPVFKYVYAVKEKGRKIDPGSMLATYIELHDSFEKLLPKNIAKSLKNVPIISDTDSLVSKINDTEPIHKKSGLLLKNIHKLTNDKIRELLQDIFTKNAEECMRSTNFKRCVMYLDLMENGIQKE